MKIGIIIGSTREGRVTERVAQWVRQTAAAELPDAELTVLDLRDYALPFFDEAISPQYNPERKPTGVVKEWLDALAAQDAIIIVTPEYNRSIPAVLKNALDYVAYELARKPVAIVGQGSAGGNQAISHLRGIIAGVLAVSVPAFVAVTHAGAAIDEKGNLSAEVAANPYGPAHALKRLLTDLAWYTGALTAAK